MFLGMLIWGQMGITQVPVWTQELMAISPRFGFRLDSWPAGDAQNIQCQGGFSDGWKGVSSFRSMGSYVDCQLAVAKSIIVSDGVAVSGALGVNYHRWNGADGLTRFRPLAILQFHLDQTEYSEVEGRVSLSPMGPQPIWQTRNDVLAQIGWERSHLNHSFRADVWWQAGGFAMRGQVWWNVSNDFYCGLSARAIAGFLGVTFGGQQERLDWDLSLETSWDLIGTSLTLELSAPS